MDNNEQEDPFISCLTILHFLENAKISGKIYPKASSYSKYKVEEIILQDLKNKMKQLSNEDAIKIKLKVGDYRMNSVPIDEDVG